jgi:hypothetical protein
MQQTMVQTPDPTKELELAGVSWSWFLAGTSRAQPLKPLRICSLDCKRELTLSTAGRINRLSDIAS